MQGPLHRFLHSECRGKGNWLSASDSLCLDRALKSLKRQAHQYSLPRGKVGAKFVETSDNAASDSSATEDVDEPSAAPEPDAGITYSFDAARGPTPGGEILSLAINKAVERFENKETEKLVRNEYNVVAKDEEEEQGGYTADDDFELV